MVFHSEKVPSTRAKAPEKQKSATRLGNFSVLARSGEVERDTALIGPEVEIA
jgi:hypothetical protein